MDIPRRAHHGHHRAVGLGQVVARLRHALRRGPAALRGVALGVRAAVPRADGEARRRLHRRHLARGRDRAAQPHALLALDGRHGAPRSTTTCGCCGRAWAARFCPRVRPRAAPRHGGVGHRRPCCRCPRARGFVVAAPFARSAAGDARRARGEPARPGLRARGRRRRGAAPRRSRRRRRPGEARRRARGHRPAARGCAATRTRLADARAERLPRGGRRRRGALPEPVRAPEAAHRARCRAAGHAPALHRALRVPRRRHARTAPHAAALLASTIRAAPAPPATASARCSSTTRRSSSPTPSARCAEGAIDPWTKPRYEKQATRSCSTSRARREWIPRRAVAHAAGRGARAAPARQASAPTWRSSRSSRRSRRSATSSTSASSCGSTRRRNDCRDCGGAQAAGRCARRARRRPHDRRGRPRCRWPSCARGSTRCTLDEQRGRDRRAHPARGARPHALPLRRRAHLPHARPRHAHALRRRGAAHRPLQLARRARSWTRSTCSTNRRIGLHPRDLDRLLGLLHAAARQRQHRADGGARPRRDPHGRLDGRARARERRAGRAAWSSAGPLSHAGESPLTGQYLTGARTIPLPAKRRPRRPAVAHAARARARTTCTTWTCASRSARSPCVTGVSGSGKSTLVHDVLYRALEHAAHRRAHRQGSTSARRWARTTRSRAWSRSTRWCSWTRTPIGRSPRSNPVTYVKAFDEIRKLFADAPLARQRGYTPGTSRST